ncbi:MAG TPA: cysteine desulfurase [Bacteroidales bacterium]|nr:cysteine desulfurase [Bacteroidales bacterium]
MSLDITKIRNDFPILSQQVYGKPLVYFDNGATTQKPRAVIDKINELHASTNSSIHRGIHYLSEQATEAYEAARENIRAFINARHAHEIIFTSGATGSINAVAFSFGEKYVKEGDEIVITAMEHHANIVPWQMLCERKGARLKVIPFNENGELKQEELLPLLSDKTKLIAVTQVSNTLGTINDVKSIIRIAHENDIPVLVDGAQAIQHLNVDVQDLDCEFYVFSGHKIYGPTGIGVLYGKEKWLNELPPYQGGGDMVDTVTLEKTTYNELPLKFEAGTTNYIGAIGLGTAIDYLKETGISEIHEWEQKLFSYANQKLSAVEGIRIFGTAKEKIAIFSFLLGNIHQYDAGMLLDKMGIAVRTGTHCTQPIMQQFGISGTIRASLAFYNTTEEVDRLLEALAKVKEMLG